MSTRFSAKDKRQKKTCILSDNNNNNKIKWIKFLEHGIKVQSAKIKEELLHIHEEEKLRKESKWSMNPMKLLVAL